MRKIFLALLIGSLCVTQSKLMAEEMVQAANVNYEPARPIGAGSTPSQPSSAAETAAREEIVRRKEAQVMAQQLIEQGLKLYYAGNYEAANAKLEQAVKMLPRAKATEIDYNRAVQALTDSSYHLADAAYRAGDTAKAKQFAEKALEYDPTNRAAENIIVRVKREEKGPGVAPTTPETTPEFIAKRDDIKRLFREGKILLDSGQYDEAEARFKQILLIDRYNDDAYTMLQQVNDSRLELADAASDKSRSLRLWQVSDSWVKRVGSEVKLPALGEGRTPLTFTLRQAEITKRLNEIIFPEINFREAVISDVINFLSQESRKLDPDHVGVNIVLGAGGSTPAGIPATPPAVPTEGAPPPPAATSTTPTVPTVAEGVPLTLNLRNVPMIDALRYVTTLANLQYRIESSAVLILPLGAPTGEMITRTYPVTPGIFGNHLDVVNFTTGTVSAVQSASATARQSQSGQGGGSSGFTSLGGVPIAVPIIPTTTDILTFFTQAGVLFPTNSTLVYNDRTSTLIVRNTSDNLEVFEQVLAAINVIPQQVEIEARFVEVSQSDLDELGFQWNVAGHQFGSFAMAGGQAQASTALFPSPVATSANNITAGLRDSTTLQGNAIDSLLAANGFGSSITPQNQVGTISGILTDPQFQLIIKMLSQKKSADLLSAPKITVVSGRSAELRVAQEFIYPTTYTPPTATAAGGGTTGGGSSAVTPAIPSAFTTREVGVLLDVIPTVGADGYTINLALIPQVSEFLGFINYGGSIALAAGNNVVTVPNDIKQPLFSTRSLATSVVIWDGQTVVLGGLINEQIQKIEDKVPFLGDIPMLGRLFRNKTTLRSKRNLLVFVSARLIDPAGNPIHRTQTASAR